MMNYSQDRKLTRVGVFYDGNYFLHVSNYYVYNHERQSRLSVGGLHSFIRNYIARQNGTDDRMVQIADAHYFRGRLPANEAAQQGNALYYDRVFDDILSSEGITTHYLPIRIGHNGYRQEKGIDVWLALEAFEQSFYKRFDVVVLIASDGDYVPLIRKLNALGTRVMVLSWDFHYTNDAGKEMYTRTSQELLEEVTYPVAMHEIIDNRVNQNELLINNLFVPRPANAPERTPRTRVYEGEQQPRQSFENTVQVVDTRPDVVSYIKAVKDGFGFIYGEDKDVFFHYTNLNNCEFQNLTEQADVRFDLEVLEDGRHIAKNIELL